MEEAMINYLVSNHAQQKHIACGCFLESGHLRDPDTGFLPEGERFQNVSNDIGPATDYIIFNNLDSDVRYEAVKHGGAFHEVFRAQAGPKWEEIYARNQP